MPHAVRDLVKTLRPGRSVRANLKRLAGFRQTNGWTVIEHGKMPKLGWDEVIETYSTDIRNPEVFLIMQVEEWLLKDASDTISKRWTECLTSPFIPFDARARDRVIEGASDAIVPLISLYRQCRAKEQAEPDEEVNGANA